MFILHSSNKTENLVAHLTSVIDSSPLSSPFEKEIFLIQSQGMERWLSQQLASHFKVWANYQFLFPSKFFSVIAQKIDSRLSGSPFERNAMLWRFESLLREVSRQQKTFSAEDFSPLKHFLSGENSALKRYQLSRQLAQIFDQYQLLRPDLLEAWQNNRMLYGSKTERWQKALWLQIIRRAGPMHRGALWLDAIATLTKTEACAFKSLMPERISVFGLNTMPPLFLKYLEGLSRHCQVHLFLLNPTQTYWADLTRRRTHGVDGPPAEHPLLSILAQQGREFQEMLLEQIQFDFEPESFELTATPNNLQQLQNDILTNTPEVRGLQNDGSIAIHACHSRMREVEVLRDQLLQALETDPKLELRDIAVMAPDIQLYEPFIAAVFHDIQHAVADRSLRLSNSSLDAFICFLNLSQSRFGWRSVLDLLEQPNVYPAFGLNENDLDLVKYWIQGTQVRWGKSAEHQRELGLPEISANTWQTMLERLLMGYAVGSDEHFVDNVLPYKAVEGSSALALGGLCAFMDLLFAAGAELKQPKTLKIWSVILHDYAERLFGDADSGEQQQLNALFGELIIDWENENDGAHEDEVELQVVIAWLEDRISEHKSAKGFLRGQLTFCSMLPMRSLPFKIIALLGLNEGEFPKMERALTFDLLARHFRKGDRSRRADDRYQFLEILLSARQQLIITYIGQSINNNSDIPCSVVISELLEVLRDNYRLENLVIRHPLQPFSPRYYGSDPKLFSFSKAGCEIARSLSAAKAKADFWWQGEIPADSAAETEQEAVIELADLFSFFQHPQRYFMSRRLDVRFNGIEAEAEEREPFSVAGLDGYAIYHEWINELLNGADFSLKKLQAQGRWPPRAPGYLEFERQRPKIQEFTDRITAKNLGQPLASLPVDIKIGHFRLIGKLSNRYRNGSLFYRFADLKGKDFFSAWLHHLIINQLQQQQTYLISTDQELLMKPDHCRDDYLPALLEIYLKGRQKPDAFFVEAALAYAQQAWSLKKGGKSAKPALQAAREHLSQTATQLHEPELNRLYGNIADLGEVLGEVFERQCQTLLLPVWEVLHGA